MSTAIVQAAPGTPMALIELAMKNGVDVEKLTGLFDLQERWEKQQAAIAFGHAIQAFQAACPPITKDREVRTNANEHMYNFAGLDDIMEIIQPHLTKNGIVVTWDSDIVATAMKTTCHVRVGTHVEHTSVTLALPEIPKANSTQKAGGALAYGKRYSVVAALGIRIKGEDNDAQGQEEHIDLEQWKALQDKINDCSMLGNPINMPGFLKVLEVDDLHNLPKEKFTKAVMALDAKARQVKK